MAGIVVEAAGLLNVLEHVVGGGNEDLANADVVEFSEDQLTSVNLGFLDDSDYDTLFAQVKSNVVKETCTRFRDDDDVVIFRLDDAKVGEAGLKLICYLFVKEVAKCDEINIENCTAMHAGGLLLGYAVSLYPYQLKRLVISGCKLKGLTMAKIATAVQDRIREGYNSLELIDLSENEIEDTGGYMGNVLRGNEHLLELVLHTNRLTDLSTKSIGIALQENTALQSLDLTNNTISAAGAEYLYLGLKDHNAVDKLLLGK